MGEWSPSHLLVVALALATIIGQTIAVLSRLKNTTERLEMRMDKQDETISQQGEALFHAIERLEERMDKRFAEVIGTMNQQLSDVRGEIRDVRLEMSKLNQNHIDHLNRHDQ